MKKSILKYAFDANFKHAAVQYPMKVIFSDGSSFQPISGIPEITIHFKTKKSEWLTVLAENIGFSESYINGEIDIEGNDALSKLLRMRYSIPSTSSVKHPVAEFLTRRLERKNDNKKLSVSLANLYRHYNLPAEFFHYMTGELYGYTEGYIETGNETQNEAQFKKYEYLCRKLCIRPGDNVVEVGSAWGTMALMMAKKFGATVTNYGLIPEQNRVFEERIKKLGLENQIKNIVRDARTLGLEKEKYDKYVSLGVYEHAGYSCHKEWIENIAECLKPGGIGLITFTGHMHAEPIGYHVNKYIWSGCYLPCLGDVLRLMEDNNLTMVDIESTRFQYADTMKVMLHKLREHWPKIQQIDPGIFTEKFKRAWELYYTGAIENFYGDSATLQAFQITFVKGRGDHYPRTREFLYKTPFSLQEISEYEMPLKSN